MCTGLLWRGHLDALKRDARGEDMSDLFLQQLVFVMSLPCLAEPGKLVIVGRPSRPLADILPYVNAVLPNVMAYQPTAATMTLRRQPGLISLYSDKVYITQVKDAAEGLRLLDALRDLLNQIWTQRRKIIPSTLARRRPGFLDVWQLLPHTSCKRCGQPGCLAFAVRLTMGLMRLDECPTLSEQPYGGLLAQLRAIISDSPPPGETSIDVDRDNHGAIGNLHA